MLKLKKNIVRSLFDENLDSGNPEKLDIYIFEGEKNLTPI